METAPAPICVPDEVRTLERDIVIVGAGFGGLAAARELGGTDLSVLVVDRRNHHLFQPLLYQVATAALSPSDIAKPIREILGRYANIDVAMAEVVGIDPVRRRVRLAGGPEVIYGRLVVATGAEYSYFGRDDWKHHAPGLKSIEDARRIRSRLLASFEAAEITADPARRAALMTSVVIGGGPTGVEMAGAIAELVRWSLARDFRHVDPAEARILLVEAGPRLLSTFPEPLAAYARERLERVGVVVRTGLAVEAMTATSVTIGGERIEAGLLVWSAGVRATPAARLLGVEADRQGRIAVGPDLSVPGLEGVHAIGDIALVHDGEGRPLPGLAQVAAQQGRYLGRHLRDARHGGRPVPPFVFHDRGNTAVVGRNAAVFDFGRRRLKGRFAWFLWALVHVYLLVGFEKRLSVTLQWVWRYFTRQRGARLIP